MKNKTRRNFIKKSSLFSTGFFIIPRNVLGGNGYVSPSDQLNIGLLELVGKVRTLWEVGLRMRE